MAQAERLCLSQRRWRGGHQSGTQYLREEGFHRGCSTKHL